jgi:hypothetical protein
VQIMTRRCANISNNSCIRGSGLGIIKPNLTIKELHINILLQVTSHADLSGLVNGAHGQNGVQDMP